jgi:HEXXH motif-containing protein
MKSNLVERIELVLRNPNHSSWFPELTTELVEAGWLDLYKEVGLSPETYGTARAIERDASAPRRIIARLPMISGDESPERMLQVETLDTEFTHSYEEAGVRFYSADEINVANVLEQLKEADKVLKLVPTLLTTVAALVRSVHLIDPVNDNYDVSFSEPHVPFSIFISVPRASDVISALRIAEAIVHEAMHLQLTLIEQVVPIVRTRSLQHYSPWRGEFRSAQGVLHGLYVFSVIDAFFCVLQSLPVWDFNSVGYIKRRRSEIHGQVDSIRPFQDSDDLTETGRAFARRMMSGFE